MDLAVTPAHISWFINPELWYLQHRVFPQQPPPPIVSPPSSSMSSYREPSDVLKRLFLPPKDPSLLLSSDYE